MYLLFLHTSHHFLNPDLLLMYLYGENICSAEDVKLYPRARLRLLELVTLSLRISMACPVFSARGSTTAVLSRDFNSSFISRRLSDRLTDVDPVAATVVFEVSSLRLPPVDRLLKLV